MSIGSLESPRLEASRPEQFVLELGRCLHRNGTPAHRLESVLERVAQRLGLEAHFFAVPTAIFAAFGPLGAQRAGLVRFEPGGVDLGKIARLDDIVRALVARDIEVDQALDAVREVDSGPSSYPKWTTILSFALGSGVAAGIFGGGWLEVIPSSLTGLVVGILASILGGGPSRHLFVPLAASVVAALAQGGQRLFGPYGTDIVVVAGLIVLLPGLSLTVALTELSTRNLVSGTARATGAGLVLVELAVGLVLGDWLGGHLLGASGLNASVTPLPPWTQPLTVALAALAFVGILSARAKDGPAITVACFFAFYSSHYFGAVFGGVLGAWASALATALACNIYARRRDRPATVPLVPAILLLVPGSLGLSCMQLLLEHQPLRAADLALEMTLTGSALAVGIVSANILYAPRREI